MADKNENPLKAIDQIKKEFEERIETAKSKEDLDAVHRDFLSKKGKISRLFGLIGKVSPEERPRVGAGLNELRRQAQSLVEEKRSSFAKQAKPVEEFDPTLPGREFPFGAIHPMMQVMDEIKSIFTGMGFRIEEGPEIETDYHNFEALNLPEFHPSRAMQDTFYLPDKMVLRTHTSPVQIRTMESQKPPVRMIAPGRCFRRDTPDASHSPTFYQVEGLCVDKNVTFADLKGVVTAFAQKLFGEEIKVRFRPSFFPFTEPSAEYDFSCFCHGKGCAVCKGTGWLEISGAGMVDPAVFGFVDYDPKLYSGYAFGMGIERIAMLKYKINDIRIFYENDIRFLEQFKMVR
jgi:phenylalanyl-tRNA synthetase alpha chain